jgi:cation diffusion facilitator family transporter
MISQIVENLFIKRDYRENINQINAREAYGTLEGWVSVLINTMLFALKLIIGILTNSLALIADAVHTLSDSVGSIMIIISFRISEKPADEEHPYGHGRVETITTLILSILLIITGFEFLKTSIANLSSPSIVRVNIYLISIVIFSIVVKEWMARFAIYLGKKIDSQALIVDAFHHRFDSITTFIVLISIAGGYFKINWLDFVAASIISLFIIYSGIDMLRKSVHPIIGEAPPRDMIDTIEKIALGVKNVRGVHDIVVHQYGRQLVISLHIQISDALSAMKIHEISQEVEDRIVKRLDCYITIHPDPINSDHPLYNQLKKSIQEIVSADNQLIAYHDLRIVGGKKKFTAIFDITASCKRDAYSINTIKRRVKTKLQREFPGAEFRIKLEPVFAY